jgi:hypothetical protein
MARIFDCEFREGSKSTDGSAQWTRKESFSPHPPDLDWCRVGMAIRHHQDMSSDLYYNVVQGRS